MRNVELGEKTPHAIEDAETSLLWARDDTRYRAGHFRCSIRGVADRLLLQAGAEYVEQLAEHLELSDTGVLAKERYGYDGQVELIALTNKPSSNVNIGRALACRYIQSNRKSPDESKNIGDGPDVSSALHADEVVDLDLINAGEL